MTISCKTLCKSLQGFQVFNKDTRMTSLLTLLHSFLDFNMFCAIPLGTGCELTVHETLKRRPTGDFAKTINSFQQLSIFAKSNIGSLPNAFYLFNLVQCQERSSRVFIVDFGHILSTLYLFLAALPY